MDEEEALKETALRREIATASCSRASESGAKLSSEPGEESPWAKLPVRA
jgi:hypothetical protein